MYLFEFPPHLVKPNFFNARRFLSVAFLELNFKHQPYSQYKDPAYKMNLGNSMSEIAHSSSPMDCKTLPAPIPQHKHECHSQPPKYTFFAAAKTWSKVLFQPQLNWGSWFLPPATQPCAPSLCGRYRLPPVCCCTSQGVIP